MEFRILGPLEALDGGRAVPLGGARQRAVLALLLTHANEVVSTDRLIDALWGDHPPRTALNTVQFYVSRLRKALPRMALETRPPGYVLAVGPDELDLRRFEELAARAADAAPAEAAQLLREALALWRGEPLADVAFEPFVQVEIVRLQELHLAAVEARVEADLVLGRHVAVTPELEALMLEHPLRERLRAQLIIALYRSGRQADALEAYQDARRVLTDELGLEPGPALRQLQQAVLAQDPGLDVQLEASPPRRSILAVCRAAGRTGPLAELGALLASRPPRELILAGLTASADELAALAVELNERRAEALTGGVNARAAAFTSSGVGGDVVRLVSELDVDLVLLEAPARVAEEGLFPLDLDAVLANASADVALLVARAGRAPDGPVFVPFGGSDHDWAAVEIAAWVAGAAGAQLKLVGAAADPEGERRDASRLLASASLIVQRALGIAAEPVLVPAEGEAVAEAAAEGRLLVMGLSSRWQQEGIGAARQAMIRAASPPTLLVRRGLRPSGVAPQRSLTRFTWSLAPR